MCYDTTTDLQHNTLNKGLNSFIHSRRQTAQAQTPVKMEIEAYGEAGEE